MATAEQPITRSELRAELQHYATKADLRAELQHYATKADLATLETRLIKWMVGVTLGGMATAATLAIALSRSVAD